MGSAAGRGGVSVLALVWGHGNSTFGALYVELSLCLIGSLYMHSIDLCVIVLEAKVDTPLS